MKRQILIAVLITLIAIGFRIFLASKLTSEDEGDGKFYSLIAQNLIDHHGYSGNEEEPYNPTLSRVPGYPLLLAGIYRVFGSDNKTALHTIQILIDTATTWLIGLLALAWAPLEWPAERRRTALISALTLGAICPFTAVYVSTVMTEVTAMFLSTSSVLAAALATRSPRPRRLWACAGILGGLAAMVRPDCGIFPVAAAAAFGLVSLVRARRAKREGQRSESRAVLVRGLVYPAILALCLACVLAPWTIRNARVFGVFQPLAPPAANNPNEWVPTGYIAWLRTWVDREQYVIVFEDGLNAYPIGVDQAPEYAFDSPDERERVTELYGQYNHPPNPVPQEERESGEDGDIGQIESPNDDFTGEEFKGYQMTREIDAAFGEIARERIERHRFRYYVTTPVRRAFLMWFDIHTQYYPFQGDLFPTSDLDFDKKQHYWLPAFLFVLWIYTALGAVGGWILLRHKSARIWLLMLTLLIVPRLAFLAWQEHPEVRYTVEFFPFVTAAAGLAIAGIQWRKLWRFNFRRRRARI